jgi:hypothetical protein
VAKEVPDLHLDAAQTPHESDDSLRCAACGFEIARKADRIEVSGAHEHTFVNPFGLVFELACFREAAGCMEIGDEDATFSWFPGWTWQIVMCSRCRVHLGWKFRLEADVFHGLIRTQLRG